MEECTVIDCETVNFIAMLNKLSRITKKNAVFIGITEDYSKVTDKTKLFCSTGINLYYDISKLVKSDESYRYYPLIKFFGKESPVYYPKVFVSISKDEKNNNPCIVAFAGKEFDWNNGYIIDDGIWSNVMNL